MTVIEGTTLVICTRNRAALLDSTLASVVAGEGVPAELLVIDQSDVSNQRLAGEPEMNGCQLRYLHVAPGGLSAARNEGIATARGEVIAFTDDDVSLPRGWFGALVAPVLIGDGPTVATGPVLPTEPLTEGGFQIGIRTGLRAGTFVKPGWRDVLVVGNMAARRATLQGVGRFEVRLGAGTRYPGGEDNEFGLRLLRAGCRIVYRPEATIYHYTWRPGSDYLAMRWRYGLGQGGFYGKLLAHRDAYGVKRLIGHLGYYGVRFPWRLVTQRRRAGGDVVFVCGLLYGVGRWLICEGASDAR